ncbi:hypothetical protein F4774DRAFT_75803 [Daldinia eschscholtzii]|nr:hypothetical protein F4774DRAFT_75803 [Daldinia eschscholtzii]
MSMRWNPFRIINKESRGNDDGWWMVMDDTFTIDISLACFFFTSSYNFLPTSLVPLFSIVYLGMLREDCTLVRWTGFNYLLRVINNRLVS